MSIFASDRYKFAGLVTAAGTGVAVYLHDAGTFTFTLFGVFVGLLITRKAAA